MFQRLENIADQLRAEIQWLRQLQKGESWLNASDQELLTQAVNLSKQLADAVAPVAPKTPNP